MVSIIVPAYNAAAYLRECLESALAQTYSDIEVIVVDDGSTDGTPDIIARLAARDQRVRPLRQSNRGISEARNAAIAAVRGEWLCFLDADDLMCPDCVELLMEAAGATGCSLVYGGWQRIGSGASRLLPPRRDGRDGGDGDNTDNVRTPSDVRVPDSVRHPSDIRVMEADALVADVLYQTSFLVPAPWAKLYRHSLFDGLRFEPGITYEDLDIFYRLAFRAGRIAVTDTPVYLYRDNPSSVTNVFSPARLDVLAVTERLESYIAAHRPALLAAARDRRLSANFNMYCLLAIHDREGRHASAAEGCMAVIRSHRRASLFNPRVRLKNKFAILLSMFGGWGLRRLSPFIYGRKPK